MKCSDARPLLDPLCDGALGAKDSALVLDHVRLCESCQAQWESLEQLRVRMRIMKQKPEISDSLPGMIMQSLKQEDHRRREQTAKQQGRSLLVLGIAAALMIAGLALIPVWQAGLEKGADTTGSSASPAVMRAEDLVRAMRAGAAVEPVASMDDLKTKVGYELKQLTLPEFAVRARSVYTGDKRSIARFDFEPTPGTAAAAAAAKGKFSLSCYQAPQGTIQAAAATSKALGGKAVAFGASSGYRYALLAKNGRDYLFISTMPQPAFEKLMAGV